VYQKGMALALSKLGITLKGMVVVKNIASIQKSLQHLIH
jgi:hypothetical protein